MLVQARSPEQAFAFMLEERLGRLEAEHSDLVQKVAAARSEQAQPSLVNVLRDEASWFFRVFVCGRSWDAVVAPSRSGLLCTSRSLQIVDRLYESVASQSGCTTPRSTTLTFIVGPIIGDDPCRNGRRWGGFRLTLAP